MDTLKSLQEEMRPHLKWVKSDSEDNYRSMVDRTFMETLLSRLADSERDAARWKHLFGNNKEFGELTDKAIRQKILRSLILKRQSA